jgi:DNA-binding response OmpR family regulator
MKILIVEDDIMIADLLEQALLNEEHEICGIAATPREAVALILQHRPDLAILDVNLKDGVGPEVVARLSDSDELTGLGILYVTGAPDGVQLDAASGHAVLRKPYSMHTLSMALAIVGDIVRDGATSRLLPQGMRLLG